MGRMHCMEALLDASSDAQAGSKCVPAVYGCGGHLLAPQNFTPSQTSITSRLSMLGCQSG